MFALYIVFLMVAAASGQTDWVCPVDSVDGRCINGNFANPEDCTNFYQCSNCLRYTQDCPANLHYSQRVDKCLYPHEAKCRVSPQPTLSPPTPESTVPGVSTPDVSTPTPTSPPIRINRTAFFVGRDRSLYTTGRVEFLSIIDIDNDFDRTNHMFTVRRDGVYLHSISAGAYQETGMDMNLVGPSVDVWRNSTVHVDHDMTSRDIIADVIPGTTAWVYSTSYMYSDPLWATSWTCVGLSDLMGDVQAFSVGRSTPYDGAVDPLTFDILRANVGGGFDITRSIYVVPKDGVYYFSISMGATMGRPVGASIYVGDVEVVRLTRDSYIHNGYDTLSRAIMLQLTQNEEVRVTLYGAATAIYSSAELQTSFTGFLYDPALTGYRFAWSLGKNETVAFIPEYVRSMDFERIIINEGNAWDPIGRAVLAQYPGYYYVHISAGAVAHTPLHLFITNNESPVMDVWRPGRYHNGIDTLSRSGLVKLAAGDRLQIAAATSSGYHSDDGMQTSFSGFYLYPDVV